MGVKLSRRGSRVTIEGEQAELAARVLRRFHEQAVHRALSVDDIQLGLVEIGPTRCPPWTTKATASRCAPSAATCARARRASATT
ncbi:hypothetical protein G6F62_014644 [Rhizopus arrhizus]|nr:hypothetical protein G6F62_014644 [Rhizopus arrhizus]